MTGRLALFSDFITCGVRSVVFLFLIFWLLSAKKPEKKSITAVLAGAAAVSTLFSVTGLPDFYRIISETILIAACAGYFQEADTRMGLFVGSFYEIAVSFWQFLFAAWLGVIFRSPAFLDYKTEAGQAASLCLHLMLTGLICYLMKRPDMSGKKAFRFASGIVLAGFLAVVTLSEQSVLTIDDDTLDMWTILAVVLMMSVLVFNMNRQYEVEKELAKLKSEQAKLLERDYTTLNNAYAMNAKLFHDFHNHIGVLRQLLIHSRTDEAMQYLDELQTPMGETADTVWTGDETVDYLINSKAAAAEENGIPYQVQVEFPRHTNLQSADLCAILGNLLDNAIEAAKQIPALEQRSIRLTIRRINQMLVIKVENTFLTPPEKQGGSLKSSKDGNGLHGWGLKSAQAAAEKYDGMIQTSYTGNTFRAVATLSYQAAAIKQGIINGNFHDRS